MDWDGSALGNKLMAATLLVALVASVFAVVTLQQARDASRAAARQAVLPIAVELMREDVARCEEHGSPPDLGSAVQSLVIQAAKGNFDGSDGVNSLLTRFRHDLTTGCGTDDDPFVPSTPPSVVDPTAVDGSDPET